MGACLFFRLSSLLHVQGGPGRPPPSVARGASVSGYLGGLGGIWLSRAKDFDISGSGERRNSRAQEIESPGTRELRKKRAQERESSGSREPRNPRAKEFERILRNFRLTGGGGSSPAEGMDTFFRFTLALHDVRSCKKMYILESHSNQSGRQSLSRMARVLPSP